VAQRVVERLEEIQVEEHQGEGEVRTLGSVQFRLDGSEGCSPVLEAGQSFVVGEVLDLGVQEGLREREGRMIGEIRNRRHHARRDARPEVVGPDLLPASLPQVGFGAQRPIRPPVTVQAMVAGQDTQLR